MSNGYDKNLLSIIFIISIIMPYTSYSQYLDLVDKTQVNKIDPLFENSVEDYKGFAKSLEEVSNDAASKVGNKEGFILLPDSDKAETSASMLSNISDNRLEAAGREEYAKDAKINNIFVDYSKPGMIQHKQDAEAIASASSKMISNVVGMLKEIGVDCKSVKGDKEIEPQHYIETETKIDRAEGDTIYDQHFCEQLRNKYDCKNELVVQCKDLQYVAGYMTNVAGNMIHTLDQNGYMTIGVNETAYFYNRLGAQNDFIFTFNVSNAKGIESFKILQVNWADHVLIKLNDQILFQSPGVNGKIEMSYLEHHKRPSSSGKQHYGVDVGTGYYITANTRRYHNAYPHYEGKQYLKDGNNVLHIRLAYGNGGKIWLSLQFKERKCNTWQEKWQEICRQI